MIELKTRDHLVYFMQCGMIRLSNYDLKFVQNIQFILTQNKPLTTNQVSLFEKLVGKYKRQLNKQGLDNQKIDSLKWNINIIPSEPAYTSANIFIEDDILCLKCPFNKKFIKSFKDHKNNYFKWNTERKRYETLYSTASLKLAVDATHQHYADVNYCPIVIDLLNNICEYSEQDIWEPTLVYKNNSFYILACNNHLYEAIKDISIDSTLQSLDMLSRYGIKVHSSVTMGDPKLEFAADYVVTKTTDDIDLIITWLKELQCDNVYFSGTGALTTLLKKEVQEKLKKEKIKISSSNWIQFTNESQIEHNYSVLLQLGSVQTKIFTKDIKKIVILKNSTPIDIK